MAVASVVSAPSAHATHPYDDVPTWVDDAVSWADANGYLEGFRDGSFRPGVSMTRGQFARFLHRTQGSPTVDPVDGHGFDDVPPWLDEAVTWLTDNEVVEGYADNTFRPDEPIRRGAATRAVHRLAGEPDGVMAHGLSDVPDWVEPAVTWVTDDPPGPAPARLTGFADLTFRAQVPMTRAQTTRLLYRDSLTDEPTLEVEVVADDLDIPWGLAVLPDGRLLFNERRGGLGLRETNGTVHAVTADLNDVFAQGETGIMGIVADPAFATNRRFHQCQGVSGSPASIKVVTWELAVDGLSAARVTDPLVGGLPVSSGRHGGCRLRYGNNGQLWIGTGDAAVGTNPQDLTSLGGKVLRIDPTTGEGSAGNPFAASDDADTRRIFTYGHRNVQGLALRPGTDQMWSVEHGSARDDEVNLLVNGGNGGWNPVPGYDESVPMTDLTAYPEAMVARWSSGQPTLATSGAAWIDGPQWQAFDGLLAVAALKNSSLRLIRFTEDGTYVDQEVPADLDGGFGRLRTVERGPDGALYVTTANGGGNDRILRITPAPSP